MPTKVGHGIVASGNPSTFIEGVINFSSTGDNNLVAAVANQTIRIFRLFFVVSAATNLIFKDGASTNLTGAMAMSANGAFALDFQNEAWFHTSAGNAFILNQSGSAQVSGRIYYQQS